MKKTIKPDHVISFLNTLLRIDPFAINALVSMRVSCNVKLANHPTVQVGTLGGVHSMVGWLGILNGMFGVDDAGYGVIGADYEDGEIVNFKRVEREVEDERDQ